MTDLLITNGRVVTQDADRRVIEDGAVAVEDDRYNDNSGEISVEITWG